MRLACTNMAAYNAITMAQTIQIATLESAQGLELNSCLLATSSPLMVGSHLSEGAAEGLSGAAGRALSLGRWPGSFAQAL